MIYVSHYHMHTSQFFLSLFLPYHLKPQRKIYDIIYFFPTTKRGFSFSGS